MANLTRNFANFFFNCHKVTRVLNLMHFQDEMVQFFFSKRKLSEAKVLNQ